MPTAETLARTLLQGSRLRHTEGVAVKAAWLADRGAVTAGERELLVGAAWLHDVGYQTDGTGFHPLDGADFLIRAGWPPRLCALVAHHSAAEFAAREHGLQEELARYPHERSRVSDALTYADQTTGPDGQPLDLDERMGEMLARHGEGSVQARIHHLREPYLRDVAHRVEHRLLVRL